MTGTAFAILAMFIKAFAPRKKRENIARTANAVPVTLYSKVTKQLLIMLFSIVSNVISVSSVKFQVTRFQKI